MKLKYKYAVTCLITMLFPLLLHSQTASLHGDALSGTLGNTCSPIEWRASARMISDKEGVVTVIATIADGWHLYGMKMPETGPKPTQVKFELPAGVELTGKLTVNRGTVRKYDDMFGGELEYWGSGELKFTRHFKITKAEGHIPIKCMVSFMGCNDEPCLPPQLKSFNITLM